MNLLYLTFTFCKVVYFDISGISSIGSGKFPLPLSILYCCQTIKLAVAAMTESLHTSIFRNLSNHTTTWLYLNRQIIEWAKERVKTIYCK